MIRERGFDSQELQGYMNAGVPLSKERMGNTREDGSADQRSRAHLVLPKLLPDAFLLQGPTNRKFMQKAESLERRRGMNQRSVNKLQGNDPFLEKLEKYKPEQSRMYKGFRGANKRSTFVTVREEDEEEVSVARRERSEIIEKSMLRLNLQDMLIIVPLKSSGVSGTTKKVLHAPSLKMMVTKEVPIYMRQVQMQKERKSFDQKRLEKYADKWQKNSTLSSNFAKLHDILWNSPTPGTATLIVEHCSGGSLKALLQSVETLPENAIVELLRQLLDGLRSFHNKFFVYFGGLCTGQILFDADLNVKLGMGLSRRLKEQENKKEDRKKLERDTFEIGIIILKCMLGSLMDKIIRIFSENMQGVFCNENPNSDINPGNFDNSKDEKYEIFKILDISGEGYFLAGEALSEHYDSFLSFLIGESRPHKKSPLLEVLLNQKPEFVVTVKFLQKVIKFKLSLYSQKLLRVVRKLTQLDPEDRKTPEEILTIEMFNQRQTGNKMSSTYLRSTLRKTIQTTKQNDGFYKKSIKTVKGGIDFEEIFAINPDLSKKANDESSGLGQSNVYLENILVSLDLKYRNGARWYELDAFGNANSSQEDLSNLFSTLRRGRPIFISRESSQIKDLAQEIGCSENILFDKLQDLINKSF